MDGDNQRIGLADERASLGRIKARNMHKLGIDGLEQLAESYA